MLTVVYSLAHHTLFEMSQHGSKFSKKLSRAAESREWDASDARRSVIPLITRPDESHMGVEFATSSVNTVV